jgi:putative sterol carrier protein
LHNLPSHQFDEVKSLEMLPDPRQEAVRNQAMERFNSQIKLNQEHENRVYNNMMANLESMDQTK